MREYKKEDQFITQNFDFEWHDYSYGLQPDVNQFEAAKCMDIAGCDIYHPSQDDLTGAEINFCGSIARGLKKSNSLRPRHREIWNGSLIRVSFACRHTAICPAERTV